MKETDAKVTPLPPTRHRKSDKLWATPYLRFNFAGTQCDLTMKNIIFGSKATKLSTGANRINQYKHRQLCQSLKTEQLTK